MQWKTSMSLSIKCLYIWRRKGRKKGLRGWNKNIFYYRWPRFECDHTSLKWYITQTSTDHSSEFPLNYPWRWEKVPQHQQEVRLAGIPISTSEKKMEEIVKLIDSCYNYTCQISVYLIFSWNKIACVCYILCYLMSVLAIQGFCHPKKEAAISLLLLFLLLLSFFSPDVLWCMFFFFFLQWIFSYI